jgi:hypothetical protein
MIRFLAAVGTLLSLVTLASLSSTNESPGWAEVVKTHHQFDSWT